MPVSFVPLFFPPLFHSKGNAHVVARRGEASAYLPSETAALAVVMVVCRWMLNGHYIT